MREKEGGEEVGGSVPGAEDTIEERDPSTAAARAATSPTLVGFLCVRVCVCVCDVALPGTSPSSNIHKRLMQQKLFPPRGVPVRDNDM